MKTFFPSDKDTMDNLPNQKMDCLPDEIIHKICLYLNAESIRRFSITCTRYANIIANSSILMKNFKLKVTKSFCQLNSQILRSQRKYRTIEIADVAVESRNVLSKIFEKFGSHLRTLIISNSTLEDFTFLTIIKCSPFLEELFISESVIKQKLPAINPISIVHLSTVAIRNTNWLVFKFLTKSQITSLLINSSPNEGETTRIHLVRMLSNQYRLRELILYGTSSKTLFRDSDLNDVWNFHLNKFHMDGLFRKNSDAVDNNIVNFLFLNNETLRSVEISVPYCEQITVFTLLNLSNLTSLTLGVRNLPKDQTFYQALVDIGPNRQLKHLKLGGSFIQSTEFVKFILNKFPEITNLELDDWSNITTGSDMLEFVANKFPLLQQLFIPEISIISDVPRFIALKQLRVSYVRNIQNVIDFIQQNRSIETLKIDLVYNTEQIASIRKLMDLTQVQHLSFRGSDESFRMIYDSIQTNIPKTLQTLELFRLSHENFTNFPPTFSKSIKISFPNNVPDFKTEFDSFLR